jgi:hypothetical protein
VYSVYRALVENIRGRYVLGDTGIYRRIMLQKYFSRSYIEQMLLHHIHHHALPQQI